MVCSMFGATDETSTTGKPCNPDWGYQSVLPYFKKTEDYKGGYLGPTEEYHGRKGPMTVVPQKADYDVFTPSFIAAGQHLGFDVIDPSGPEQIGQLLSPSVQSVSAIRLYGLRHQRRREM
ncbi:hypothetical protein Pcinc_002574 [Petrolisthes cinctipes]|uniref:Uncharacterized protein n=1 Tax=Petrolisthes cinctipes TaxID=88211 RepID=A0AAE1GJF5_PETCI|nr:hypothetical protein Pcinc_002574 [Petrolisthes cinctipes]